MFALIAYLPFFWNNPGRVSADTKAYLHLSPSHLLATATSMWNSDQAFGMVTHQNIGLLFPMGPYFWLTHTLGIPTWIAQRFWMGSLLFLAGLGVRKVAQELGLSRIAGWGAALPYVFTPFILVNIGRTSAILMPWAGLGWLLLFAIRSARFGGWKNPARFAIVVALVGGVNATSILLVGLAPAIWLLFAGASKELPWRAIYSSVARIGVLCTAVSIWWLAGLWAEGKFGIDILRYTETIPCVASTSSSSEVFRGLGYWYFYGSDHSQSWTSASYAYTSGRFTSLLSLILPTVAVVASLFIKWRYRTFAVVTAFLGVVIAVGAYPYQSPTPVGSVFKWFGEHTTVGLAMRSTNRVIPITVLAFGLLIGASIDAWRRRFPRQALSALLLVFLAACLGMTPLFKGTALADNISSPETLPSYLRAAANDLNTTNQHTSVLGLPGLDFGNYRWGALTDPVWPGVLQRPFVTSQVTLQGQMASVNLIRALDTPIQELIALPQSIAPIARLLGTGDVLFQFDTQYERFSGPEPWYLWQLSQSRDSGLVFKKAYGPVVTNHVLDGVYINESNLALPRGFSWPKSLAIYGVADVRQLVRTESSASPAIVAGDGEGLVSMANLGLIPENRAIFYDGALNKAQIDRLSTQRDVALYLTDSNQRRLNTFGILQSSAGLVQMANEVPLVNNPSLQPLSAYPNLVSGAQTVAILGNARSVQASSYGNPIASTPEVQPYLALDGSLRTGWSTSAFSNAIGEFIQIDMGRRLKFNHIRLAQGRSASTTRYITDVRINVDGKDLGRFSLAKNTGQSKWSNLKFPSVRGTVVKITIEGTSHDQGDQTWQAGVGFREIQIPGLKPVTHSLLMPTSLLRRVGNAAATSDLHVVMTRSRVAPTPPRTDPEPTLDRTFELPFGRTFSVQGTASLQSDASNRVLSALLDIGGNSDGQITSSTSSSRLVGSLRNRSWAAFDGNTSTSWMPGFQTGPNTWIEATTSSQSTVSHVDITFVNDGMHMIPTKLMLSADGGSGGSYTFDTKMTIAANATRGQTETLKIDTSMLKGTKFRLSVLAFKAVDVKDRVTGNVNHPPIAITEMTLGALKPITMSSTFDTGCRSDLLSIDGKPVPIAPKSKTLDALAHRQFFFAQCGPTPLTLSAGMHHVRTFLGRISGITIDNLSLNSAALTATPPASAVVNVESHWSNRWTINASIPKSSQGQFVVVGQSFGPGWVAHLDGVDLGPPVLIDGASMGWALPATMSGTQELVVTWTPQSNVNMSLLISLFGLLLCLWLALGRAPRTTSWQSDNRPEINTTPIIRRPALTVATSVVVALCVSWWFVPLSVAAAIYLITKRQSSKFLSFGVALLLVGASMSTYVITLRHWSRSLNWPSSVPLANGLTWMALAIWVLLVVATTAHYESPPPDDSPEIAPERRRGLNVALKEPAPAQDERELLPLVVAPRGALRTLALFRAIIIKRRNPDLYRRIVIADAMNQIVGKSPLYNRTVLEIANHDNGYAEGLAERGARITKMRREIPPPRRGYPQPILNTSTELSKDSTYSSFRIPAEDEAFDLVVGTNVLSSVEEPQALINELVRVTRRGGTIYLQNTTWFSPWGGRETSPWHLISGNFARKLYIRRNGLPPENSFQSNFYRLRIREMMRQFHSEPRLAIVSAHPRYLPLESGWLLRIPVIRELVTVNLVVQLERTFD